MALANIVGDLCYVGFAFEAEQWVSYPKLCGALFTIAAHIVLLAYGDDELRHVVTEDGLAARCVMALRVWAKAILSFLPSNLRRLMQWRPVALSFGMLALNGVGLLIDVLAKLPHVTGWALATQGLLGALIVIGCLAFVAADLTRSQTTSDGLLRIGPTIFMAATVANAVMALQTHNFFLICGLVAFGLSNIAGFFTKIDKDLTARPTDP